MNVAVKGVVQGEEVSLRRCSATHQTSLIYGFPGGHILPSVAVAVEVVEVSFVQGMAGKLVETEDSCAVWTRTTRKIRMRETPGILSSWKMTLGEE